MSKNRLGLKIPAPPNRDEDENVDNADSQPVTKPVSRKNPPLRLPMLHSNRVSTGPMDVEEM